MARAHRLSKTEQDDVAQQTWARLHEHIERVRRPAAIGGWLTTVARRECVRMLAASRHECPHAEPGSADDADATDLVEAVAQNERRIALHVAIDALPDHEGRLIRALLAEPTLNYDQLSAALGIPRGSIGPRRARALVRLRSHPALARCR